ncbi:MAG TPA: hypothetical protein VJ963_10885, partial [Bacteroidales bacterium]|nr:hypothetical protein [Bacteroidales bacterium]
MEIKNTTRSYLPHIVAVVAFIVISFAYFYPVLEGKVLKANDSTVSTINSKEIRDYRAEYGKDPLWTNSIFSGMPGYLISTHYPGNLFKYVDSFLRTFRMPVSVLFLSMLGFYILLIIFGLNPWLSITGAIAYGLSSFFFQVLAAGHNTQAIALAYMPTMIAGIYYAYKKDAVKGALMTAFFLALEIQANHPQITYYGLLCLLVFGITELIYSIKTNRVAKFFKTSAILIIPFIIAVGINFASLYTTYQYGKYSIRGKSDLVTSDNNKTTGLDKDYITFWSYGIDETFNMLIPDYKGGSSEPFSSTSETATVLTRNNNAAALNQTREYWGTQPGTDGPHYVGAIVIFLFVLGLILVKGPEKWWLVSATILSIMLSWGKNFMFFSDLFINYFPGYNKFRAVTMILVIAEFCIPLLGFLALRDIYKGNLKKSEILKGIKIATAVTGGFLLLVIFIPGIAGSFIGPYEGGYPAWLTTALIDDRKTLLKNDAFRSLIFILMASGTILAYTLGKIKAGPSIAILTVLVLLDLWTIDKRYLNADRFEMQSSYKKSFKPTLADGLILKDTSDFRVLNLSVSTFNDNTPTSYFFHSIGGYHGAKLQRYQELIDSSLIRNFATIQRTASKAQTIKQFQLAFDSTYAINMLNAKYVIYSPDAPPVTNPRALGNAWFDEKVHFVKDANSELAAVNIFDPSRFAIVNDTFKSQVKQSEYPTSAGDTIYLVKYEPNRLSYRYHTSGERLAVFSEIYYPE